MQLIESDNAEAYLRASGRLAADQSVRVRALPGGVSNRVLYVEPDAGPPFVLKQARPQLRVPDPWFCSVERIWREVEVLRWCRRLLGGACPSLDNDRGTAAASARIPDVLFEDRSHFLFAMTAAPPHEVWKDCLLRGDADTGIAAACGTLLGRLHRGSWRHTELSEALADHSFFDDLRLDPFYRHQQRRLGEDAHGAALRSALGALVEDAARQRWGLVHGDFSPKNLLVYSGGLMLVDFEVGHYGDPAFDLGFFLSHVILKTLYAAQPPAAGAGDEGAARARVQPYVRLIHEFHAAYARQMASGVAPHEQQALWARGLRHAGGCVLARVDGKSKVDYLGPDGQQRARALGRQLLLQPVADVDSLSETVRNRATGPPPRPERSARSP